MKIELKEITIRELVKDYQDSVENGVTAYGGKLDIRPPYQREFVYKEQQRNAVIETVKNGFPLNVIYWADKGNGEFEIIDGQQRTISICQYVKGDFSVTFENNPLAFHNLQIDQQNKILDYQLMVYQCSGTDSEKLKWFETINIAGEQLTPQELRNAVYSGSWVTDAKRYFSKNHCVAQQAYGDLLSGSANRQEYLETAIKWIAHKNNRTIELYMAEHQHDENASELWQYFQEVFAWVKRIFSNQDKARLKLMKGQEWGIFYNQFKDKTLNAAELEKQIQTLILDDDVGNKKGIYPYLLTEQEKYLSLRAFSEKEKQQMYALQQGICNVCKEKFELDQMEADHITPWSMGGKTEISNGQMLCKSCNRRKSNK